MAGRLPSKGKASMSKDPLKNWQLEEGNEPLDQWKLQDTEQEISHLQLQTDSAAAKDWQPVEYQRTPGRSGRNWVLPSIVIVALLVALGYVAYVSLGRLGLGDAFGIGAAPTPTSTPETVAGAASAPESPTAPPTPTSEPPTVAPTATPEPTPTPALISVRTGTVNDTAGVNARRAPNTTGEIIRLLNNGERMTIVQRDGDWLQVILADNQPAWVAAQFIDQAVGEQRTLEEWNALLVAAGLPPVTVEALAAESPTPGAAPSVNVKVLANPGATVRLEPASEAQVVEQALVDVVLPAAGRTESVDWLLVTLPSGQRGWILTDLVTPEGDLTTLPVQPANVLVQAPAGTGESASPTPAAAAFTLEVADVAPPAPFTNTIPLSGQAVAITDTLGVNARTAPTLTAGIVSIVPNGAVLTAVGRSPDNQWIQVELPDSQRAWVFRALVSTSSNIEAAPLIGESTADTPAAAPTATANTGDAPIATINSLLGSNVRATPSNDSEPIETASRGATFPVTGRSADGAWLQVTLDGGAPGWILAATADLNVEIATIPVAP